MAQLFQELKRRSVFRVGLAYLLVAWLIAQVTEIALDSFAAPGWVIKTVLFLLAIGFPVTLIFAWAFELTPEGIRRDSHVDRVRPVSQGAGRKLDFLIIGALVIALGYFVTTKDPGPAQERANDAVILSRPMVAVLPFVNSSRDSTYDHLGFGLMDEIIISLQRFKAFPIVSRGAVLAFRGGGKSVPETADELHAEYVVSGSIAANGDDVRVRVTMTDRNDQQVWAKRFVLASGFENLFAMTDEVAASIAGAVRDSEVELAEEADRPPVAAWEHYIKGLSVIMDWRRERHEEGRNHIKRALDLDPDMAEAWWALGELENLDMMATFAGEEEFRQRAETTLGYFRRAHELSPFQGGACGCLGITLEALDRVDEAFVLLDEALEVNPLSSVLHVSYAQVLANQGRFEEARLMAESGARMEPMGRDLALLRMVKATTDLAQGRSDEARENIYRAIYAHHRGVLVTPNAIMILYVLGDRDAAAHQYQQFVGEFSEFSFDNLFTVATLKPIASLIAVRHGGNSEFPPNVQAIVDELAGLATKLD